MKLEVKKVVEILSKMKGDDFYFTNLSLFKMAHNVIRLNAVI